MNDPFENIIKQARCIANSEETVRVMDSLRSENVKLRQTIARLIEAGNAVNQQNLDLSIDGDCTVNYVWDNIVMECQK